MNNIVYVSCWNKKYPIVITKSTDPDFKDIETAIHVECRDAWFDQEWDSSDLWKLIELIPELIGEKKKQSTNNIISLKITQEEKAKIKLFAKQSWYRSISEYIKAKALVVV